jgi:hypothetical protein
VLWEESGDVVVGIMSIVEREVVLWVVVAGVTVAGVGVAVVIDDWIIWVVLKLILLVVVAVTVGELIGVSLDVVQNVHVLLVDWVVFETGIKLKKGL